MVGRFKQVDVLLNLLYTPHTHADEAIKKELIIDLQARKGNVPSSITKKISDIIDEGDRN